MKKSKMIKCISQCITERRICCVYTDYNDSSYYCYPLKVNEKFFLGAGADDIISGGYYVRRLKTVDKVRLRDSHWFGSETADGMVEGIVTPDVNIESWRTVFRSLRAMACNVIVEHENRKGNRFKSHMGRIEKAGKKSVWLRRFDAAGIWETEPTEIPYSAITSVTFGSRYVEVFSRHLPQI